MVSNWHPFSFNFFFGNRRKSNQGSVVGGGWQPFFVSPETIGWGWKCETGRCHGEAARSFHQSLGAMSWHIFTQSLQNVAVEPRIHSLACWDWCFAPPVRNILDTTSYVSEQLTAPNFRNACTLQGPDDGGWGGAGAISGYWKCIILYYSDFNLACLNFGENAFIYGFMLQRMCAEPEQMWHISR
jgi:hypothetical protein